jgi:hypothetical protein
VEKLLQKVDSVVLAETREMILDFAYNYRKETSKVHKGLLHLLEHWHNFEANKVLEDYCNVREDAEVDQDDIDTIRKRNTSHIHEEADRPHVVVDVDEEYFRLLPTSETRNSEISSTALNNINNQS